MNSLRSIVFATTLTLLNVVPQQLVFAQNARPNVLMLVSDDQGWGDYGFMKHEVIQTPHLDRLASESLLFTRGYVPCSLCRPSLFTMLSGMYPHQHCITGNDPPKGVDRKELLPYVRKTPMLPRLLAGQGYACFQSGKWWEGNYSEGGFTAGMTHGDPAKGGRHGDEGLKIGRQGVAPVLDFIKQQGEKPFFVWYAPMLPHQPHYPPARIHAKYARPDLSKHLSKYYACVEWFDESCGEILKYLDDHGLRENTIVLYVTDNGWIQDPQQAASLPHSKRSPYDGGVRTPIMVRWPAKVKPKRNETDYASSIDLVPTVLSACGLPAIEGLPGRDLIAVGEGKIPAHDRLFGEIFEHDIREIGNPKLGLLFRWGIVAHHKVILPTGGPAELYDLQADPHEKNNLAAKHPQTVAEITAHIDKWWNPN